MNIRRAMLALILAAAFPAAAYSAGGPDPDPGPQAAESPYDLGRARAKEGNWVLAASLFRKAVKKDEKSFKALNMLGYSLRQMGRLPEAIQAYDRALAINPNFGQALEYRGIAHLKAGNREAALRDHQSLVRLGSPLAADLKEAIDRAAAN
ncbi:MAG: tetratricopeptide repeat protein [Nitrospinota bacterium]|jgi:tetratricopeptide (TPR) repeat protein